MSLDRVSQGQQDRYATAVDYDKDAKTTRQFFYGTESDALEVHRHTTWESASDVPHSGWPGIPYRLR